jgi:hypothetical protein
MSGNDRMQQLMRERAIDAPIWQVAFINAVRPESVSRPLG